MLCFFGLYPLISNMKYAVSLYDIDGENFRSILSVGFKSTRLLSSKRSSPSLCKFHYDRHMLRDISAIFLIINSVEFHLVDMACVLI